MKMEKDTYGLPKDFPAGGLPLSLEALHEQVEQCLTQIAILSRELEVQNELLAMTGEQLLKVSK